MPTTAADIMTRDVVTVRSDTPVREVADLLAKCRFGSVPVTDETGRLVGLVTEEDMVRRAADIHLPRYVTMTFLGSIIFLDDPARFKDEAEKILATTAGEIMDAEVPTVTPDSPVDDLAERMLEGDLRRLVVLDAEEHIQGIITRADIVRMLTSGDHLPPD